MAAPSTFVRARNGAVGSTIAALVTPASWSRRTSPVIASV
jgi:hypothetical protein